MTLGPDSSQEPEYVDLRLLLLKIFRNFWFILGIALLAGVLTFALMQTTPDSYETSVSVLLNPDREASDQMGTLIGLVGANDIAEAVIDSLGEDLSEKWQYVPDLLDAVQGVEGAGGLIVITVTVDDATEATLIANTWAEKYVEYVNEVYLPAELDSQVITDALGGYESAQGELVTYVGQSQISELQRLIDEKQQLIDSLQDSKQASFDKYITSEIQTLSDSYAAVRRLTYLLSDVDSLLSQIQEGAGEDDISNSIALLFLKVEAYTSLSGTSDAEILIPADVQLQMEDLSTPMSDAAAQVQELQTMKEILIARLEEISADIDSQSALLASDQILKIPDTEGSEAIAALEDEIRSLSAQLEAELAKEQELTDSRDLAWQNYLDVKEQQEEMALSADMTEDIVSVASLSPQAEPQAKGTLKTVGIAALVGLLLAVGSIWLVDYLYPEYEFSNMLPKRLRKK